MAKSWEDYILANLMIPLYKGAGKAFFGSIGRCIDMVHYEFISASQQFSPFYCRSELLPLLGRDRNVVRFSVETDEDFRFRIWNHWDAVLYAGTKYGILEQLRLCFGTPNIRLIENSEKEDLPDGNNEWKSRFWIEVDLPNDWLANYWADGKFGDMSLWGSNVPPVIVEEARAVIKQMKPADAYCWSIIVNTSDGQKVEYEVLA